MNIPDDIWPCGDTLIARTAAVADVTLVCVYMLLLVLHLVVVVIIIVVVHVLAGLVRIIYIQLLGGCVWLVLAGHAQVHLVVLGLHHVFMHVALGLGIICVGVMLLTHTIHIFILISFI